MATLKLYTDKGVRSGIAKTHLQGLGVNFDEVNVELEENASAIVFLESKGRDRSHYPLPQYYVNETVAYNGGYKEVVLLTAEQINSRIEEINAG